MTRGFWFVGLALGFFPLSADYFKSFKKLFKTDIPT